MKLPQPFKIDDINTKTKAVVIALLIGLLLVSASVIATLFHRIETNAVVCKVEKKELYDMLLSERQDRILLYESMLFYKARSEKMDSIVERTKPLVNQILTK
ncbi:MAG: hypothetical protein Q4G08_04185 [Capnocytophaga sp.]|nr:hypothetical protein [Capnocytophaga sp.]